MRQLVTDRELRRLWDQGEFHTFTVEEGTVVTPSARDFLLEHRIELKRQPRERSMTVEPIAAAGGAPRYVIYRMASWVLGIITYSRALTRRRVFSISSAINWADFSISASFSIFSNTLPRASTAVSSSPEVAAKP